MTGDEKRDAYGEVMSRNRIKRCRSLSSTLTFLQTKGESMGLPDRGTEIYFGNKRVGTIRANHSGPMHVQGMFINPTIYPPSKISTPSAHTQNPTKQSEGRPQHGEIWGSCMT